jgi:hypothetical protein
MTVPIYSQFTFGSSTNYITFNDESGDFIFKARRRLAQNRELRQFDTNVPDEPGIVDYQTLPGREYYVIEGTLYGVDEGALYRGMEKLRKVTSVAVAQDDPESDDGYLPLKWAENTDKQLMVKPLYVDIPETRKSAMKPAFKILFKIKYPFIESQTLHTVDFSPEVTAGVGTIIPSTGLVIPAGGVTIGADVGTGNGVANNAGDYKVYPTITFNAPINVPRLTNSATGKFIEFNYNLATGTATIQMRYDGITAVTSEGVNIMQYLTADSDIENFYLVEGTNQLTLNATSIGSGADCTISWRDSWPI